MRSSLRVYGSDVGIIESLRPSQAHHSLKVRLGHELHLAHDIDVTAAEDTTPTSSRAQSPEPTTPGTSPSPQRNLRATSEPPEFGPPPSSSPPQYSWEWGSFPVQAHSPTTPTKQSSDPRPRREHERSSSLPPFSENIVPPTPQLAGSTPSLPIPPSKDADLGFHFGKGGRLSAGDSHNGFVIDIEGESYEFDLSLCGDLHGMDDIEAAKAFTGKKVSFEQFLDDPAIVHNDELVVRWNDRSVTASSVTNPRSPNLM